MIAFIQFSISIAISMSILISGCPPKAGFPVAVTASSKQQAASKQAKVYVCMYVYVREYELRSRNLIGGGPVLTGREWQA